MSVYLLVIVDYWPCPLGGRCRTIRNHPPFKCSLYCWTIRKHERAWPCLRRGQDHALL